MKGLVVQPNARLTKEYWAAQSNANQCADDKDYGRKQDGNRQCRAQVDHSFHDEAINPSTSGFRSIHSFDSRGIATSIYVVMSCS